MHRVIAIYLNFTGILLIFGKKNDIAVDVTNMGKVSFHMSELSFTPMIIYIYITMTAKSGIRKNTCIFNIS